MRSASSPPSLEPSAAFAAAYAASMPADYRTRFSPMAIQAHAAVVARRGARMTWIERWALFQGACALCVVADDAPGLLSLITASIVVHDLDVTAAHAYCRTREDGRREAVDLLWVTHSADAWPVGRPVEPAVVACVGDVLDQLVRGKTSVDAAEERAEVLRDTADASVTKVWFSEGTVDGPAELRVETGDRPGILFAIAAALFREGVQILRSDANVTAGIARDCFDLTECDGRPLGALRRERIRATVLAAIETRRSRRRHAANG
jgi:UTP:GlnB (protein PII) uridylyltransferase